MSILHLKNRCLKGGSAAETPSESALKLVAFLTGDLQDVQQ